MCGLTAELPDQLAHGVPLQKHGFFPAKDGFCVLAVLGEEG